jgi:hypothetical protein
MLRTFLSGRGRFATHFLSWLLVNGGLLSGQKIPEARVRKKEVVAALFGG